MSRGVGAKNRILIVDDDPKIRKTFTDVLKAKGYAPVTAATGKETLDRVEEEAPAVAVIDLKLEGISGLEVIKEIKQRRSEVECIVITGYASQESAIEAVNSGAYGYIQKPYNMEQLLVIIRRAIEKREAEEALRESEERYRNLFEKATDGVFTLDRTGRFTSGNRRTEEICSYKREELIGKHFTSLLAKKENLRLSGVFQKVLRGKMSVFEVELKTKSGELVPLEITTTVMRKDGKIVGTLGMARDVAERKRAGEQWRKERDKAQKYLNVANTIMVVIDSERKVRLINQKGCEVLGHKEEEILNKDWHDNFVPEGIRDEVKAASAKLMAGEMEPVEYFENPVLTKSGKERLIAWHNAVLRDEEGNITATLSSGDDITEHKRAEEQLERSFIDLAETVSRAMSCRDPYTAGHQRRVAYMASLVGEKMGLDNSRLQGLYIGGLLHDIGKISTPETILTKPGKLTMEEWSLIRAHTKQGYDILKEADLPWPVAEMALHHHERLDGSGYPDGISGDALSLEVRILAVCDVVEAMSSYRPYRQARSKAEVLEDIKGGRGTKYDVDVVDIMLEMIESGEFEMGGEAEERTVSVS